MIPNWTDTESLVPREHGEHGRTSTSSPAGSSSCTPGNLGYAQDLETLLYAATHLRDLDDLELVPYRIRARGVALADLAKRLELGNVRFLCRTSRDCLAESLSAAHVHVVGLAPGLAGYVVPSRLYGFSLSDGPFIVYADEDSETAGIVRAHGCGIVVPPSEPELLARAIRDAYDGRVDLEQMGAFARA